MKKVRWYEVNEIPLDTIDDKDIGDVSSFEEPGRDDPVAQIRNQPTYFDALKMFQAYYEVLADPDDDTLMIPSGGGAFEKWWLGKIDNRGIEGEITKEDILKIAEDDPQELFSLFTNTFYSSKIGKYLDIDTLTTLVSKLFEAAQNGKYASGVKDYLEAEFKLPLEDIGNPDVENIWEDPEVSQQLIPVIANRIKQGAM